MTKFQVSKPFKRHFNFEGLGVVFVRENEANTRVRPNFLVGNLIIVAHVLAGLFVGTCNPFSVSLLALQVC